MPVTQLTLTEANNYLDTAITIINEACKRKGYRLNPNGGYSGDYNLDNMKDGFMRFVKLIRQTDFDNLTPGEQANLRGILRGALQRKATKIAYCIMAKNIHAAYLVAQYEMPLGKVKKIHGKHAKRFAKKEIVNLVNSSQEKITAAPQPTPPKPQVSFPALATINPPVDTAVKTLRMTWTAAIALPALTTEDKFLLNETANTYLPDAWRMYNNLAGMPEEVQTQAAEMLLTQVNTLNARIKTISGSIGSNALKELRAHTNFISQKTPADQAAANLKLG